MSEISHFVREVRDEVVTRHDENVFGDGFNEAADLAMVLLRERIDQLRDEIRTNAAGSSQQQALLLVELTEIKDNLDRRFREYWKLEDAN